MKQIAKRITFDELHKLPEGTEFTACFTDDVKRGLHVVILKKRSPRNYAERTLDGVQILGTDRDGKERAIPKGVADFSVTLGALLESNYGIQSAEEKPENPFDGFPPPQAPRLPVNPERTDAELAAIQQLATEKDMPPSQVIRQALRLYQSDRRLLDDAIASLLRTAVYAEEPRPDPVVLDGVRLSPNTSSGYALGCREAVRLLRNIASRPYAPVEPAAPRSE